MRCDVRGFSFDAPADWDDRSVVAFAPPPSFGTAASISITHDRIPQGMTLHLYADQLLLEIGQQLNDFELDVVAEAEIDGMPALRLRFTWLSHQGRIEQTLTFVRPDALGPDVTTFTTTAPVEVAARCRPIFDGTLASVRFARRKPVSDMYELAPDTRRTHEDQWSDVPVSIPMPGFATMRR
jgi:hypothetical protein